MKRTPLTEEQKAIIVQHYPNMTTAAVAELAGINEGRVNNYAFRVGLRKSDEHRSREKVKAGERLKTLGSGTRFTPGRVPVNKGMKAVEYMKPDKIEILKKTQFKPGQLPHNTKPPGQDESIRVDKSGKSYYFIRLSLANWIPKHTYLWQLNYGKPPPGHVIAFKDGNTLNCELANLECISRAENLRRNRLSSYPPELTEARAALKKLKKIIHQQSKKS